jgi:uncharacterized membrane protein YcaP (DUF421 family)
METVFRAIAAYIILWLLLRITARRSGQRMTSFEILLIFLLGGQMTQSILGEDRSLVNALTGVCTIALMHTLFATIKQRSRVAERIMDGTPLVVYADEQWIKESMDLVRVQKEDVMASARGEGVAKMSDVKYAIVERNGSISILKKQA